MSTLQYTDLWPLIQRDILAAIASDPFLGTRIGVLVEPGDIESNIATKLAKALGQGNNNESGVGYLVLPIERADDEDISNPFGPYRLTITVQWVENVVINQGNTGTGVPIRIWAGRCAKVLKLYTPVYLTQSLVAQRPNISEFTEPTNKNLRVGQVEFTALEADATPLIRLSRPAITVAGAGYPYAATITCPNSVTIYYTLDGSHPWEGNPQATLYANSVNIAAPCLFRARAFGAATDFGTIASDTAAYNFT
jgi:hypothetical protein